MEELRGLVEHITYRNEENEYCVVQLQVAGEREKVSAVGIMPGICEGSILTAQGSYRQDARYGRQFAAEHVEMSAPSTREGVIRYLGSGLIKGIGKKLARRIVEELGEDALGRIEEDPGCLSLVGGIGRSRAESIRESLIAQREIQRVMVFLQSHGVPTTYAVRIYKAYGEESIVKVTENPYRLADEIWGIGFATADRIAGALGMGPEKFVRIRSGILYTMEKMAESGDTCADREALTARAVEVLGVGEELVAMTLDSMVHEGQLIPENQAPKEGEEPRRGLYLPRYFFAERDIAKRLSQIASAKPAKLLERKRVEEILTGDSSLVLDEVQREAVTGAACGKVFVLTGGPGTGKTTTTRGIIEAFRRCGVQVSLAAPTGRAAKRMSEACGMESKTIHRLLEMRPPGIAERCAAHPLELEALIVDECSMIDTLLMKSLLDALPDSARLILVGDVDQLPSVGAGAVLRDILASGVIPKVSLERIYRQAMGSRIVVNAHRIRRGEPIDLSGGKDSDFFFASARDDNEAMSRILSFVSEKLPAYYRVDPVRDIQVLSPMQRGICGVRNLNERLQAVLNPGGTGLSFGSVRYLAGDKVMQLRNDYDKDVFNGDIGRIVTVDREEGRLVVNFDGREVPYERQELDELGLAYAATIHKSQGSEYPIVVIPVVKSQYVMLQRNLLYTGVTRAKKILVLVGDRDAVGLALRNEAGNQRATGLCGRIRDAFR